MSWLMKTMFLFSCTRYLILVLNLYSILDSSWCESGQDVSHWMCADENCSKPIAEAVVTKPYNPDDPLKIPVKKGEKLRILRQIPEDSDRKLVYVESLMTKKRGLLSNIYIQERKILVKNEKLISTNLPVPVTPDIKPSVINPSATNTVIDGTTIPKDDYDYPSPYASYEPTQTPGSPSEPVVQSTTPPSIPPSDLERSETKNNEVVGSDPASNGLGGTPIANNSLEEKFDQASVLPAGDENAPDVEVLGISSTPASTLANADPSLTPNVPKDPDIVKSTTRVPSPLQESEIDGSQKLSNSPPQPVEKQSIVNEPPEGSGSSPGDAEPSRVKSFLPAIFSSSSGSGEVEDDPKEKSADANSLGVVEDDHVESSADASPPDVQNSLRRGPNPRHESDTFENEKLDKESSEAVETVANQESTGGKSKSSGLDISESPINASVGQALSKEEPEPVRPANHEQGSVDVGEAKQGSVDSTPSSHDPGKDLNPASNDSITDAGSEKSVGPNTGTYLIKQDSGQTVDPAVATKAAEKDLENNSNKSSDANPNREDLGMKEEPTKYGNSTEGKSDMPQQHTQETRVSMSSSHKSDANSGGQPKKHSEDVSQQELEADLSDITVETDESLTEFEDTNNTSVGDQASPESVHEPSEVHKISSAGITTQSENSEPSRVGVLKSDPSVDSKQKVLEIEKSVFEEGQAQVGVEDIPKDYQEPVSSPSLDGLTQQVSSLKQPASEGGPADLSLTERPFGWSELKYVDPRETNPDLNASDPPSTEKAAVETSTQSWAASVEEVPLYNQWSLTPEPSVPPADPVPTAQPSLTDQPSASDTNPEPNPASGVGVMPSDQLSSTRPSFQELDPSDDSAEPWYYGIFSVFGTLQDMMSGDSPDSVQQATSLVTPKTVRANEQSQTSQANSCDAGEKTFDVGSMLEYIEALPARTVILMVVTAGAVLIFSLGYYFLENQQRDVELVSKYNELLGKLFIEQKEKETLAEQLTSANESLNQISFDTTKFDDKIRDLNALVQKYKEEKAAIEEKEKEANRRRIISDKNYNDLLKTLSMHKQKGERSALNAEVKNLKDRIEADEINIASLKEQLLEKKDEVKSLNAKISDLGETNQQLERNVEKAISHAHENAQKYQENISKLEKTIEENMASIVKLEAECTQLKKEKESLAIEKELAESSLQKFQQLTPSNALTDWLDAKEVRVSLLAAEKKMNVLSEENEALFRDKKQLEEKWKNLKHDLDHLNENYEKAEREKIEALTKLQVLSDYFKEKETQLQEELGSKEALWLHKQSDDRSIYEQMRALREENTSFKNQNETLKREILEQEASYKKLIASANEKADEHWVALRHTERRLKEAQMEASQLRSRLSTLGATSDNPADKIKGEVNGDLPPYGSATSPQFMLYPHEFVPPPPLPTTTPSRPPPLGRISSPPPVDFVPPPPIIPFESLFLPPSPPPPVPHAMMNITHKPQPLDGARHRTQKDSQSSNQSSESTSDKPRRNKR